MVRRDDGAWAGMAEDALIAAVVSRQPGAWDGFYRRYERLVVSCIKKTMYRYTALVTEDDIEDTVSTVCLLLVKDEYKKLRSFDITRGYKLSSWIGLIATNAAHDALRRRAPGHDSLDDVDFDESPTQVPDCAPSPAERLERRSEWQALLGAIQELSEPDRLFIELYYDQELEPEQIAEKLQISVNTVYSRKNKIREKLRKSVEKLESGKDFALSP